MSEAASPQVVRSTFRSPGFKLILIIVLTVVMSVPLFFVQMALSDRQSRAGEAAQDIAQGWGGTQVVGGPILFVPYEVTVSSVFDGRPVQTTEQHTAALLPSTLNVAANAKSGMRWRGIFPVPVYKADVGLQANFDHAAIAALLPPDAHPLWNQAYISLLVSDVRGLADNIDMKIGDRSVSFQPGTGVAGNDTPGVHVPLGIDQAPNDLELKTDFVVRGLRELSFAPLGQRTTAILRSDWRDPSFFGAFLPSERRIDQTGFEANWTVPYLARGFGQTFAAPGDAIASAVGTSFGVRFYQPVDFYQLVQRSLKYAILFVGLAFLVFFVAELVAGRRLHGAQYALIGAAQVLFYLLLLSLAEHVGFLTAYILAAGATIALTSFYAASVFASPRRAGFLSVLLTLLYGLLYVILIQEDYALLVGTSVLFLALGATMFATRKLDWSRVATDIAK